MNTKENCTIGSRGENKKREFQRILDGWGEKNYLAKGATEDRELWGQKIAMN